MADKKVKNMEEFAAVSGISRPTVSKYFNDPDSVRKSTRERIEQALERHNFRPNIYAINQNRRQTKNIGIVVPYLADPFFAEIARNIERRCIEAGFYPILFSSHGDQKNENDILDNLRSLKPAGALLAPLGRISDKAAIDRFCEDVPTILFDSNVEDVGRAFVGSDNKQFASLMVEYLCRTGSPPCLFEMKTPANPNSNKRRNGYLAAMERAGHAAHVISVPGTGWGFEEIGYQEGKRVLREGLPTDTVLCSNDRLAIGFLAAAYELGFKVGHAKGCSIRVAGHDDHPFSRYTCPSLTTIAQDYSAISEEVIARLLSALGEDNPSGDRDQVLFEGKLVMRSSA